MAITNGGGIRGDKEYLAGAKLTRGDVLTELPFGNKTVKLELSGARSARRWRTVSQVEQGTGRFPQVSGLSVEVTYPSPLARAWRGHGRCRAARSGRDPHTLATNDFMARGGDGCAAFAGAVRT